MRHLCTKPGLVYRFYGYFHVHGFTQFPNDVKRTSRRIHC